MEKENREFGRKPGKGAVKQAEDRDCFQEEEVANLLNIAHRLWKMMTDK